MKLLKHILCQITNDIFKSPKNIFLFLLVFLMTGIFVTISIMGIYNDVNTYKSVEIISSNINNDTDKNKIISKTLCDVKEIRLLIKSKLNVSVDSSVKAYIFPVSQFVEISQLRDFYSKNNIITIIAIVSQDNND